MELKKVQTDKAPAAIGPYSQAIISGNMVFTSGQIPLSAQTGEVVGADVSAQAEQVMNNLCEVLVGAGCTMESIVKTTCFLADMADFAAFNVVYEKHITHAPARSCVAVRQLPKSVLVEVEAIAQLP